MTILSKSLENKVCESYLYYYENVKGQLYNLLLLNWYLLGVGINLGNAHKTRFWFDS